MGVMGLGTRRVGKMGPALNYHCTSLHGQSSTKGASAKEREAETKLAYEPSGSSGRRLSPWPVSVSKGK